MKFSTLALSLSCCLMLAASQAFGLGITEAFVGLPGQDGTEDWFELTNNSGAVLDTGTLHYDDSSEDFADGGTLDSILLAPGESAIFLISDDNEPKDDVTYTTAIEEFQGIWGASIPVGLTNGGGGLSQDGDQVTIFNATTMNIITKAVTPAIPTFLSQFTVEYNKNSQPLGLSVLGERGAYESTPFFNDNPDIGGIDGSLITVVGSPGVATPEPTSLALVLAGVMGLAGLRNRK